MPLTLARGSKPTRHRVGLRPVRVLTVTHECLYDGNNGGSTTTAAGREGPRVADSQGNPVADLDVLNEPAIWHAHTEEATELSDEP